MGILFTRGDYATSRNSGRSGESNLKLEAQKVKEFTGDFNEWNKWKSRTECAFEGSGYELILSSRTYANENIRMNKIVYSQLSAATVDGNAHHLIKAHDTTKDGHAAWCNLCEWYDGDVVQSETADELRSKLDTHKLHPGVTATSYLNNFLTWNSDIAKIPGEALSESHSVYMFLKNITDPDYKATVQFCRNNNTDLMGCVSAVRKTERDLLRQRAEKRRFRHPIKRVMQDDEYFDDYEEQEQIPPYKRRRLHQNSPRRLDGTIDTDHKGRIHFPNSEWFKLTDEEKAFFEKWNGNIKNGDSVDDLVPPKGITINNKARRVGTPYIDRVGEPEDNRNQSRSKKRIGFNLEDPVQENDGQ